LESQTDRIDFGPAVDSIIICPSCIFIIQDAVQSESDHQISP
jgi:hypothetical protein